MLFFNPNSPLNLTPRRQTGRKWHVGKFQGRCGQEELCGLDSRELRRVLCYVDLPYMARLSENMEMGIEKWYASVQEQQAGRQPKRLL